ncbi:tRNA-dihydrouridine(47) synthase [NAD(P)(+)]-like protein [Tyrophagus putrescentiae]|nr:tRNA-dihydrouridine(47) synthase [NAD(P)(+)]-like protein [Tyrophagus putrescentiae]
MDTAKEAEPISVEFAKNEDDSKPKIDHFEKGYAPIKAEFIVKGAAPIEYDEKYLTKTEHNGSDKAAPKSTEEQADSGEKKRPNEENAAEDNTSKDDGHQKKRIKGQNKHRRNVMFKEKKAKADPDRMRMCVSFCRDGVCSYGERCTLSHDVDAFREPDLGPVCHNFTALGKCNYGVLCRFGSAHLKDGKVNVVDEAKVAAQPPTGQAINFLSGDTKFQLQRKRYDFSLANEAAKAVTSGKLTLVEARMTPRARPLKNGRIDFAGKLYLAPLTTVGNLPFRRICKEYGADITCGEMALSTSLLEGNPSEWALLRRHHTEDLFGVQICGAHADQLARAAQLITEHCSVDFIDLNMGCPIDLVFRKGAGSALMDRRKRLEEIIYSVGAVTDVPLTLKMRTGVYERKAIARNVISAVREWSDASDRIGLITVHGRSREQRYTKNADWTYISECVEEAKRLIEDENGQSRPSIPVFGSGDVLSHEDYYHRMESTPGLAGVMIARGALIKPWLFTEIKERRTWDIAASERLDLLRKYTNYGLENWGSDSAGVEKTRRFLLEWLSFAHRYIPVGLLERLPQRINDRPPRFVGRSDLETLLSSGSVKDWIAISEMLLGPVPADFSFIPKHKANAY